MTLIWVGKNGLFSLPFLHFFKFVKRFYASLNKYASNDPRLAPPPNNLVHTYCVLIAF